jgi:hypothetical protein
MRHLLPYHGEETTPYQFAQNQAKLLALLDRQQIPKFGEGDRGVLVRWRWGGAQAVPLSDMTHLLVAKTGVAGTSVPAATTRTHRF